MLRKDRLAWQVSELLAACVRGAGRSPYGKQPPICSTSPCEFAGLDMAELGGGFPRTVEDVTLIKEMPMTAPILLFFWPLIWLPFLRSRGTNH